MDDFTFYFKLGWQHILNLQALDHLMFLTTLSAVYLLTDWRQVLILITAFTIGHSLTLALSTFDVIRINSNWVEFLIPLTIIITALTNLFQKNTAQKQLQVNYFLPLFFGLIHGLGFANNIRFMLAKQQHITLPLLGFNLGIEAGQMVAVLIILLLSFIVVNKIRLPKRWWVRILSGAALSIAIFMFIERWPLKT